MSLFSFFGAVEIGLIFALVALGVYLSFRLLRFPDLTVDGSFPLGGAVCAVMIVAGFNPWVATAGATLAGAAAGLLTGWLNVRLKIMDLLASILVMIGLYSVNLRIMDGPNVPLIAEPTLFTTIQEYVLRPLVTLVIVDAPNVSLISVTTLPTMPQLQDLPDYILRPMVLLVIVVLAKLGLDWFFATERGLAIRATGSNARMARAQGINTGAMVLLGMAISNGLVGLAGALFVQTQGGADISMGIGTIVIGLAAVIVGESILPSRRIVWATLAVVLGAIVYRFFIAAALNSDFIGLKAQDLNLVTALLVTLALVLPRLKRKRHVRAS